MNKRMGMKRIIMIVAISAIVICAGGFAIINSLKEDDYYESDVAVNKEEYYESGNASENETMLYEISKSNAAVKQDEWQYDPRNIDEETIDKNAEAIAEQTNESKEDAKKRLMQQAKKKRALYLAAIAEGYTATEQEVKDSIEVAKKALHESEEGEKELEAIFTGMNCTEEEYWEKAKKQYETSIIINKYTSAKISQKKKGKKAGTDVDQEQEKQWYDEITKEAMKKYDN